MIGPLIVDDVRHRSSRNPRLLSAGFNLIFNQKKPPVVGKNPPSWDPSLPAIGTRAQVDTRFSTPPTSVPLSGVCASRCVCVCVLGGGGEKVN